MCKERPTPDELEEFLSEIGTMKTVSKHPNVVSLLGCCTIRQPLLMIMEYIGCGDLVSFKLYTVLWKTMVVRIDQFAFIYDD